MAQKNYTLGRGEVHFSRFKSNTQDVEGFRYIGNTPEFNVTIETEDLDHFSSDRGIREKDDSVPLETTRQGTLTTDDIQPENLAYFFFGSVNALAVVGATVTDEQINDVKKGYGYHLGITNARPEGATNLTQHTIPTANIVVTTNPAGTTYVEGTDYSIDMTTGLLTILETGTITEGSDLLVDYKTTTGTVTRIISGSTPIEGSLRYYAKNPKGKQLSAYMPWVKLSPNGDFALKGEEWQQIPFNIEILKKTGVEAVYWYDTTA
jgi:hypothetical protein